MMNRDISKVTSDKFSEIHEKTRLACAKVLEAVDEFNKSLRDLDTYLNKAMTVNIENKEN